MTEKTEEKVAVCSKCGKRMSQTSALTLVWPNGPWLCRSCRSEVITDLTALAEEASQAFAASAPPLSPDPVFNSERMKATPHMIRLRGIVQACRNMQVKCREAQKPNLAEMFNLAATTIEEAISELQASPASPPRAECPQCSEIAEICRNCGCQEIR